MSTWAQKLEQRLATLADSSSKESMQTLAKWIGFNRKHKAAFCEAFTKVMREKTRQWIYFQVINEVMLLDMDSPKWDKTQDIRIALGETIVIPEVEKLDNLILIDQLRPLVDKWDNANVFGGPVLIQRIQHLLKNPKKPVEFEAPSPQEPQVLHPTSTAESVTPETESTVKDEVEQIKNQSVIEQTENTFQIASKPKHDSQSQSMRKKGEHDDISFDFEAEGVPQVRVDAKEFLEPCKALATLQIARDLRADAAAQLTSILASVPDDVKKSYRGLKEDDITDEQVEKLSVQLTDNLLDVDLDEALQNVETFRELVQKQHAARQHLVNLLIKSRCQFGSNEAAKAFFGLDEIQNKLQRRKDLLSDAMDLEGLDFVEGDKSGENEAFKNLDPISWYDKDLAEPEAKRTKRQ